MRARTKDWIYQVTPQPVIRHTLPRLKPGRTPFHPHVLETGVIFVHIPKTAGTSLIRELYGDVRGGHHRSLAEYDAYDPARTASFFTCAFVRNPWDRLLSAYSFLTQGVRTAKRDDDFAREVLSATPDFESFVLRLRERQFRRQVVHFDLMRTQAFWICLPGRREHGMDFLGRFESLGTDLERLRAELAARGSMSAAPAASPGPVEMVHDRRSDHAPYRSAYTDRMRDVVGEVYARDVELFGYGF